MTEDVANSVLIAASGVVDSLSDQARQRLDEGAQYVRLPRYAAVRLIAAVDALREGEDA